MRRIQDYIDNFKNPRRQSTLALTNKVPPMVLAIGVFLSSFLLALVTGSLATPAQDSQAVTGLGQVGNPTLNIGSTSGQVNIAVAPSSTSATLASGSHDITASTNVPTGYRLSMIASEMTCASKILPPITGTLVAPIPLANNTWGFALKKVGTSTPANTVVNGFDTSYAVPVPAETSKWAGPTSTSTIIKATQQSASNDNTTVYYGAKVDYSTTAGEYSSTVAYTATAHTNAIPLPTIVSVTPNSGTAVGGTPIQIVGTGFTANNQSVATAVTVGGVACSSVSVSSNTPIVGQDTIYCNTPPRLAGGVASVAVKNWAGQATATNAYTYKIPTPTIATPITNQILGASTTSVTLAVTTDIAAVCYYGTATNPTIKMTTTGGTSHSQVITGLTSNSMNTRHVRCRAESGTVFSNYSGNVSRVFYVRATTPATPAVSPASGATVLNGTTTITVTSSGATCTWGTSLGSYPYSSRATRTTTTGTNTLYYRCLAGSGNTQSDARTGSWSYTGKATGLQEGGTIQDATKAQCNAMTAGQTVNVKDTRDNKTYRVRKMKDGNCWMVDNLAYNINTAPSQGKPAYNPSAQLVSGNTPSVRNRSQYAQNPAYTIPNGGVSTPSYLYNWCAALGDTSANCSASANAPTYSTVQGSNTVAGTYNNQPAVTGICPAPFRLPKGGPGATSSSLTSTANEFSKLDIAMGGIGESNNNAKTYNSWFGTSSIETNWTAVFSGYYNNVLDGQGSNGFWWSSTASSGSFAYSLYLNSTNSNVHLSSGVDKNRGHAVRCVL